MKVTIFPDCKDLVGLSEEINAVWFCQPVDGKWNSRIRENVQYVIDGLELIADGRWSPEDENDIPEWMAWSVARNGKADSIFGKPDQDIYRHSEAFFNRFANREGLVEGYMYCPNELSEKGKNLLSHLKSWISKHPVEEKQASMGVGS